jgi:hypothetical protein
MPRSFLRRFGASFVFVALGFVPMSCTYPLTRVASFSPREDCHRHLHSAMTALASPPDSMGFARGHHEHAMAMAEYHACLGREEDARRRADSEK